MWYVQQFTHIQPVSQLEHPSFVILVAEHHLRFVVCRPHPLNEIRIISYVILEQCMCLCHVQIVSR